MIIMKSTIIAVFVAISGMQNGTGYKLETKYSVPGNGGWDYITIDSAARRLYLSHGTEVNVVDAEGDCESAVVTEGLIYVNMEDTNEVITFDPKSLTVKNRFPIGVAKGPTGLAYDAKTKRLFIGCNSEPKLVVMDATSGKVINSFPIGRGVDFGGFDPQAKLIFMSSGEGFLSVYHEKSADDYEDAGAVKTQARARTMAFDPKTKKIFLPTADFVEGPPASPGGRPTRTIKPAAFVVLVASKSPSLY